LGFRWSLVSGLCIRVYLFGCVGEARGFGGVGSECEQLRAKGLGPVGLGWGRVWVCRRVLSLKAQRALCHTRCVCVCVCVCVQGTILIATVVLMIQHSTVEDMEDAVVTRTKSKRRKKVNTNSGEGWVGECIGIRV
jgi:hypothetical protein